MVGMGPAQAYLWAGPEAVLGYVLAAAGAMIVEQHRLRPSCK